MIQKTYYSWECPPRILSDRDVLDFRIDFDKVFKGIKVDSFTELPKIIEFKDIEKNFLKNIVKSNSYYKIIADTNAYSLSPESMRLIGKNNLKDIFCIFRDKIQKICDYQYGLGKVKVVLFTNLIKDYTKSYNELFLEYSQKINDLVKDKEFDEIKKYLKKHVGIKNGKKLDEFTKNAIASYIVEGVIIPKVFSSPIWFNFDEPEVLANFTNRISKKVKIINAKSLLNKSKEER